MNVFFRAGELLPNFSIKLIYSALLSVLCFSMFSLSAQTPRKDSGAGGLNHITALKIGDTIPETLWNTLLQVTNHPSGKDEITLNDYRDKKLIILDFWATWCGSCLEKLPAFHRLVMEHPDIGLLPVTHESNEKVENLFTSTRNEGLKELWNSFVSVTLDTVLNRYFPHQSVPFVVFIKEGKVFGFPPSLLIDYSFLTKSISANKLPIKRSDPISSCNGHNFSSMQGFREEGVSAGITTDSIAQTIKMHFTNYPIARLYQLTGLFDRVFSSSGLVLADHNIGIDLNYTDQAKQSNPRYLDWYRKNLFSYQVEVPSVHTVQDLKMRMKTDLDFFLGVRSQIVKKEIDVLVLRFSGDIRHLRSKALAGKLVTNAEYNYIQRCRITDVIDLLKPLISGIPILDETGITGWIDVDLPRDCSDLEAMKAVLQRQGLVFYRCQRPMDVLLLSKLIQ